MLAGKISLSLKRYIVTGTLSFLVLAVTSSAFGLTDEEREKARTAANEGREAFDAGNYERCIEQFQLANEIIRAPTHTLYLARAHEKLGRLVRARELYLEIQQRPLSDDAPPPFLQAQAEALGELQALEPRIPRITIDVFGLEEDPVEVTMNDEPVPSSLIGLATRVDPGTLQFRAKAGEKRARSVRLTIQEGEEKTVVLELLASEPPERGVPKRIVTPVDSTGPHAMTVLGYGAIGLGAAALGFGIYFTQQKGDRKSEADSLYSACNPRICTDEERLRIARIDEEAKSNGTKSTLSFIAGGVAVAGGVSLLLLAPSKDDSTATGASVQPWVRLGSAGVSGRF